jgi:hypothetical protein
VVRGTHLFVLSNDMQAALEPAAVAAAEVESGGGSGSSENWLQIFLM